MDHNAMLFLTCSRSRKVDQHYFFNKNGSSTSEVTDQEQFLASSHHAKFWANKNNSRSCGFTIPCQIRPSCA